MAKRSAVRRLRRVLVGLGVLAALVVGGALAAQQALRPSAPAPVGQVVPVTRGTIASTINATGSVVAAKQAKLVFASSGRLQAINAAAGDQVKQGQPLARLASEALQVKLEQSRSQLAAAQLKLAQISEGATPEEIAAAQAAFDAAQAKYADLQAGPNAADLRAAEASVVSAQASYDQAAAKLRTLESGATQADLVAAQSSVENARNGLAAAEAKLTQLAAGSTPEDMAAVQASVDSAQASLRSAEAKLAQVQGGATPADLVAAQAALDSAQATLASSKAKLDQARAAGTVPAELTAAESSLAGAQSQLTAARNALFLKEDDLAQAQANLTAQEAGLRAAEVARDETCGKTSGAECASAKGRVETARASLVQAQNRLTRLGERGDEIRGARDAVVAAQRAFEAAQAKLAQLRATQPIAADLAAAQAAYDSAVASVASATAKLDQLKAGSTPADLAAAQGAVESARAALVSAEAKRTTTEQGATEADRVAALTSVDTARATLASAEAKLAALGQATPQDLEAARSALNGAQAGVVSAQAKLDLLRSGPTTGDLEQGRSAVASAQSSLALKTSSAKETDLALQQEAVRQAELAVRQAQLDLDNATLVAPFDGVVANVSGNVGEMAPAGATGFITLLDPREVRVDVTVDESDVARAAVGKPAQITFDALAGRPFTGKVVAVAPSGTPSQGVVTYLISLSIDTRGQVLPAGLTASAVITVDRKDNVLNVPTRAVRRQGREQVVEVLGPDGKATPRVVKTGVTGEQQVEITDGLAEGDQVVLPGTTTRAPTIGGGPGGGPGRAGGPGGQAVVVPAGGAGH